MYSGRLRDLFRRRPAPRHDTDPGESDTALVGFVAVAAIVGAATGVVAATFRLLLDQAEHLRAELSGWTHGSWWGVVVTIAVCSACAAAACALVYRVEPHAEGSGIPRVEAVVAGRAEPGRLRLLPIKYLGGLLSIGSGMALGREGPSVQMGGSIAGAVAALTRRCDADLRILTAGGAAAGLATAFNAPLAGGIFVLEELVRRFDPRTTVATLVACAAGFAAARPLVGDRPEFTVPALPSPAIHDAGWVLCVGVVTGIAGVLYSKTLLRTLRAADRSSAPPEVRAAAIGAVIGILVWCAPDLAGGGDQLTQNALSGHGAVATTLGVFALRFGLGAVSYAAGTPGGLFAPMLVLGADLGLVVGLLGHQVWPGGDVSPSAMALIGMAAFFTAVVHAPVTGIVLAAEMTGATNQLPPMLGACAIAYLIAITLRSRPVYDLLAERSAGLAHS
ncbi:ClC family H(+)/Cl(-) exchange transporter [Gordonia sp. (in: high G+C Gram-positive bacteria)]|uniref:ClC family H(+)/Cl(-) exchange transporter n=1 Tax=Gordonia sp. (in: high G+C Gram-positive bacteria) TaxID=84139 RepID=UPI0035287C09